MIIFRNKLKRKFAILGVDIFCQCTLGSSWLIFSVIDVSVYVSCLHGDIIILCFYWLQSCQTVAQLKSVPHWLSYREKLLEKFVVTYQSFESNAAMLLTGRDGVWCLNLIFIYIIMFILSSSEPSVVFIYDIFLLCTLIFMEYLYMYICIYVCITWYKLLI